MRIVIQPSIALGALLGVLHLAAAALGGWLPVPTWPKLAFFAAVAWSLRRALREVAFLRAPGAIVAVNVTSEGKVIVCTRSGVWLECELLPTSFVSYSLTILNLKTRASRRERHVVLCCGNVNTTDLRRLRVWLRWAASTSVSRDS